MKLSLYWQIAKNTFDEAVAYRTSFILYRVREFLQLIAGYFVWLFVIPQSATFLGYTQSVMLTYILIGALVNDVVFSSRTSAIATEINEGNLTNFLIRPLHYLKYHFARDFGDKVMNIVFSLFELSLFFVIIHPPFIFQADIIKLILFILSVLMALILHFFISVLISFVGFWSNEGWGPRFIFYQLISFTSGSLFPLDMLPKPVFAIFQFLPSTYLTFFPVKIYLGGLTSPEIVKGFSIMFCWIIAMYFIVIFVWKKGLKAYTAQGR